MNELTKTSKKLGVDPEVLAAKLDNDLNNISNFLNQSYSDISKTVQSWGLPVNLENSGSNVAVIDGDIKED